MPVLSRRQAWQYQHTRLSNPGRCCQCGDAVDELAAWEPQGGLCADCTQAKCAARMGEHDARSRRARVASHQNYHGHTVVEAGERAAAAALKELEL